MGALVSAKHRALDCESCERDDKAWKGRARPGPSLREQRGCKGTPKHAEYFWDEEFGGGPLERCPVALLMECEWWGDFRDNYMFWKERCFPGPGGWRDQAGKLVDAILYFDREIDEYVHHRGNA